MKGIRKIAVRGRYSIADRRPGGIADGGIEKAAPQLAQ
jgi:hypothetical protein